MPSDCYLATMVKMYWATSGYKGWNHCHEISKISTVMPELLFLRRTNKFFLSLYLFSFFFFFTEKGLFFISNVQFSFLLFCEAFLGFDSAYFAAVTHTFLHVCGHRVFGNAHTPSPEVWSEMHSCRRVQVNRDLWRSLVKARPTPKLEQGAYIS